MANDFGGVTKIFCAQGPALYITYCRSATVIAHKPWELINNFYVQWSTSLIKF